MVSLIQLNAALIASGSLIAGTLGDCIGAPGACLAVSAVSAFLILAILFVSPFLRALRLSRYGWGLSAAAACLFLCRAYFS